MVPYKASSADWLMQSLIHSYICACTCMCTRVPNLSVLCVFCCCICHWFSFSEIITLLLNLCKVIRLTNTHTYMYAHSHIHTLTCIHVGAYCYWICWKSYVLHSLIHTRVCTLTCVGAKGVSGGSLGRWLAHTHMFKLWYWCLCDSCSQGRRWSDLCHRKAHGKLHTARSVTCSGSATSPKLVNVLFWLCGVGKFLGWGFMT